MESHLKVITVEIESQYILFTGPYKYYLLPSPEQKAGTVPALVTKGLLPGDLVLQPGARGP